MNSMQESNPSDRRRHSRHDFAYPVSFKLLSKYAEFGSFNGFVQNMSISGASLDFEDRYGRLDIGELKGINIKVSFIMPQGGNLTIPCCIRRAVKDNTHAFAMQLGIEFINMEEWQIHALKELINRKNKDRNMMWTLWEQYERQP